MGTLYYIEARTKNKEICAFLPEEESYKINPYKILQGLTITLPTRLKKITRVSVPSRTSSSREPYRYLGLPFKQASTVIEKAHLQNPTR